MSNRLVLIPCASTAFPAHPPPPPDKPQLCYPASFSVFLASHEPLQRAPLLRVSLPKTKRLSSASSGPPHSPRNPRNPRKFYIPTRGAVRRPSSRAIRIRRQVRLEVRRMIRCVTAIIAIMDVLRISKVADL